MIVSFLTFLLLSNQVTALATDIAPAATGFLHRRCGKVSQFYNPKPSDWQNNNVDQWLANWMKDHGSDISSSTHGFAGAFGNWAMGNPDFSCRIDGSEGSSCDIQPCDNRVLNNLGDNIRPAYYVLEAIQGLHTYFMGFKDSFEESSIGTAFMKESFSTTFYQAKNSDRRIMAYREIINAITAVIGIAVTVATAGAAAPVGAAGGAMAAMAGGAMSAGSISLQADKDDTLQQDADLGALLGKIVVDTFKNFINANNDLMAGKNYDNSGDIKSYLQGGLFVNYPGVNIPEMIDVFNSFFIANAVNQLWRQQKVFIMGGAKCGDGQGIGEGPQDYSVCRDGKAWYLYYWHEGNGDFLSAKQWGYVTMPPGADKLGQDIYQNVTVADVINSSIDSYNVAEYNYDANTAQERVKEALEGGWRNPGAQGTSWEGTFTIPVCDVSGVVNQDWQGKEWVLQDYGSNSRPVWCGPICSNDWGKTQRFINAANMGGFKSPKHLCKPQPNY
ncbi:hypothetical protein F5Y06DRAFT_290880 [Hypoxylon sp. FL0890]|nr:hypothetical protein F5Y06DRAFT_290880 [Hypoxylon sp. FL0890]